MISYLDKVNHESLPSCKSFLNPCFRRLCVNILFKADDSNQIIRTARLKSSERAKAPQKKSELSARRGSLVAQ